MNRCKLLLLFVVVLFSASLSPVFAQPGDGSKYPDYLKRMEEAGDFAPLFAFQPSHAAPANITNVATWPCAVKAPAGSSGFISAKGDRFVDADGRTVRFLGTNICFTGCFPEHQAAERVAEELARYGINIVRLHYVHHAFPPGRQYPETDSFIEPEQLERFDYLFAKLKEHGIYTYFQLNIARKFGVQNGFENADRLPWYNNGVDNFDARMIELQKRYHSEILNHVNKYTGLRYKDEPAIAMLELSNENSIVHTWFSPKHRMPNLVEPYASDLRGMWNDFLEKKYGTDAELRKAWLSGLEGDGTEFVPDGMMKEGKVEKWGIQPDAMSKVDVNLVKADPSDKLKGECYFSISVEKIGATPNMPQFYRRGLKAVAMTPLCLRMKVRSDKPCSFMVRYNQFHSPWSNAGLDATVQAGKKWKEVVLNFTANIDDPDVRILFSHFTAGTTVQIADVSLKSGMEFEWPKEQSLKSRTVAWPGKNDWSLLPQRAIDFTEFLSTIEANYFDHLRTTVKSYIKAKQPVTGTQLHYGLDLPQARMDYVDYHCYWNHPVFRNSKWDNNNWSIRQKPLVTGDGFPGSNLATLSRSRILGKPITVSEFDHPNLNPYAAEGNLMASAQGAFQNWSGILQFAWSHSTDFFRTEENMMFDMCSATQKLVHLPACWAMFVRGDVCQGTPDKLFVMNASAGEEIKTIARNQNTVSPAWERNNLLASLALAIPAGRQLPEMPRLFNPVGRTVIRTADDVPQEMKDAFNAREITNNTGEITWNWQEKDAGFFKVDTRNTKVFSGFVRGRSFDFRGMTLTPGKTRLDWLTLSLTLTNPQNKDREKLERLPEGTYLLAATGLVHNTGAVIKDIGGGNLSFSKTAGGDKGKGPILCEGIDASLTFDSLAGRLECRALDGNGDETAELPVTSDANGNAVLHISPEYQTVWYKITVK